MMMTREQMLDKVVRQRGFEDKYTVWFSTLIENNSISDIALECAMICALSQPIALEEEEDDE